MSRISLKEASQIPTFRLRVADQMADYRKRLAERLQHERERKSLSQDTLALKAGVSSKTIKRIEEQKVDNPRPVTIRRIAEALDVEPAELRPPGDLEQDQLNRIEAMLKDVRERLDEHDPDVQRAAHELDQLGAPEQPPDEEAPGEAAAPGSG